MQRAQAAVERHRHRPDDERADEEDRAGDEDQQPERVGGERLHRLLAAAWLGGAGDAQQEPLQVAAFGMRERLRMIETGAEPRDDLTLASGVRRRRRDRPGKRRGVDVLRAAERHQHRLRRRAAERLQIDLLVPRERTVVIGAAARERWRVHDHQVGRRRVAAQVREDVGAHEAAALGREAVQAPALLGVDERRRRAFDGRHVRRAALRRRDRERTGVREEVQHPPFRRDRRHQVAVGALIEEEARLLSAAQTSTR